MWPTLIVNIFIFIIHFLILIIYFTKMEKFGTSFQSVEGPTDGPNLKNARLVGVYFGA